MTTSQEGPLSAEDILGSTETEAQETSGQEAPQETPVETNVETPADPAAATPQETPAESKDKPLFTAEQQEAVNRIVQTRLNKERSKSQTELYALQQELDAMKQETQTKPTKEDFGDDVDGWNRHLAQEAAREVYLKQQEEAMKAQHAHSQAEAFNQSWLGKVEAYKQKTGVTDYQEKVTSLGMSMPQQAVLDIMESDLGPDIAYRFANNPSEAEKYGTLNQRQRDRYLARVEFELSQAPAAAPQTPAATPKVEVSQAPAPVTKPQGGANKGSAVSLADWMNQRNKESGKSNFF